MQAADTVESSLDGSELPCSPPKANANHHLMQYSPAPAERRLRTPPISRLPIEILSMTFEWLARMLRGYTSGWRLQSVQLIRVCKLWATIVTKTRSLWQEVEVCHRTQAEWFIIALGRSRPLPIDVSIICDPSILPPIMHFLAKEAPRIRSLDIMYCDSTETNDLLVRTVLSVDQLPRLESLQVSVNVFDAQYELPYVDNGNRFPALRTLALTSVGIQLGLGSSVLSRLRVLRLDEAWLWEWQENPVPALLDVLRACEHLEEFSVTFDIMEQFASYAPSDPPEAHLSLPRLRSFTGDWPVAWTFCSPFAVYQLLEHLHFSPSADISVTLEVDLAADSDNVPEGPIDFMHILPRDPSCLPMLTAATTATLYRSGFGCRGNNGQGSLEVLFRGHSLTNAPMAPFAYSQSAQLDDVCTVFAQAPLTSLTIELDNLDCNSLVRAFTAFPHLSTLDVCGGLFERDRPWPVPVTTLLIALLSSPGGSSTEFRDARDRGVVLPELRTLRLKQAPWSANMLRLILSCLVVRAQRGGVPLSALHVDVLGKPPGVGDGEREDAAFAALQVIVEGPVEYVEAETLQEGYDT